MVWSTSHAVRVQHASRLRSLQQETIAELEELESFIEARLPANVNTPVNAKLRRALERDVAAYFRALGQAMPEEALEQLYYRYVGQE